MSSQNVPVPKTAAEKKAKKIVKAAKSIDKIMTGVQQSRPKQPQGPSPQKDGFWSKLKSAAGSTWNWFSDSGWVSILQAGAALLLEPGVMATISSTGVIPAGTIIKIVPLTPQMSEGSNLKVKAGLFAKYRFVRSYVEVKGLTGATAATGAVAVFINPDPSTLVTGANREAIDNAVETFNGRICRLDQNTQIPVPAAEYPLSTQNSELADPRFAQQGVAYILAYTDIDTTNVAFDVTFKYEIEFAQDAGVSVETPYTAPYACVQWTTGPQALCGPDGNWGAETALTNGRIHLKTGGLPISVNDPKSVWLPAGIYDLSFRGYHTLRQIVSSMSLLQKLQLKLTFVGVETQVTVNHAFITARDFIFTSDIRSSSYRAYSASFAGSLCLELTEPSILTPGAVCAAQYVLGTTGPQPTAGDLACTIDFLEVAFQPKVLYGDKGVASHSVQAHLVKGPRNRKPMPVFDELPRERLQTDPRLRLSQGQYGSPAM